MKSSVSIWIKLKTSWRWLHLQDVLHQRSLIENSSQDPDRKDKEKSHKFIQNSRLREVLSRNFLANSVAIHVSWISAHCIPHLHCAISITRVGQCYLGIQRFNFIDICWTCLVDSATLSPSPHASNVTSNVTSCMVDS